MTDEEPKKVYRRVSPQSELDLTFLTTDGVWGKPEISEELKTRLNKSFATIDEKGKKGATIESLWGLLGFYTRDMRLGNLDRFGGELDYCKYHLNLANDLLQMTMIEPFLIALSRVATVLELSQSKGGFLRKNTNTFRQVSSNMDDEPPKKNLFGMGKTKTGGH